MSISTSTATPSQDRYIEERKRFEESWYALFFISLIDDDDMPTIPTTVLFAEREAIEKVACFYRKSDFASFFTALQCLSSINPKVKNMSELLIAEYIKKTLLPNAAAARSCYAHIQTFPLALFTLAEKTLTQLKDLHLTNSFLRGLPGREDFWKQRRSYIKQNFSPKEIALIDLSIQASTEMPSV